MSLTKEARNSTSVPLSIIHQAEMYTYKAYGQKIISEIKIPELPSLEDVNLKKLSQIKISVEKRRGSSAPNQEEGCMKANGDEIVFRWNSVGKFLVQDGRSIRIFPEPHTDRVLLRAPLLGPVIAAALFQQGFLVLHASAVELEGKAFAFFGRKGWGKSTLAAAFYAEGHSVLTDDVLVVKLRGGSKPLVAPSFPRLKLSPKAAELSLGDNPDDLEPVFEGAHKRARYVREKFSADLRPIGGIYVLDRGDREMSKNLTRKESLMECISHSYIEKISHNNKNIRKNNFERCKKLSKKVRPKILTRRVSFDTTKKVVRYIKKDIKNNSKKTPWS